MDTEGGILGWMGLLAAGKGGLLDGGILGWMWSHWPILKGGRVRGDGELCWRTGWEVWQVGTSGLDDPQV